MTADVDCPGCGGPKSRSAKLCKNCRRRAIDTGVTAVVTHGPNPAPAKSEKPISQGQIAAFWAKLNELARWEEQPKEDVKLRLLAETAARVGRPVTSLKQLSFKEANELLDGMEALIRAHGVEAGILLPELQPS